MSLGDAQTEDSREDKKYVKKFFRRFNKIDKDTWKQGGNFAQTLGSMDPTGIFGFLSKFEAFSKILEPFLFMFKTFNMELLVVMKQSIIDFTTAVTNNTTQSVIKRMAKALADFIKLVDWAELLRVVGPILEFIKNVILWLTGGPSTQQETLSFLNALFGWVPGFGDTPLFTGPDPVDEFGNLQPSSSGDDVL
jgi:hypothetical protein